MVFSLCATPALLLLFDFFQESLGANPIEAITHETGEWALRFLLITLMATPAKRYFRWNWTIRIRRMLGLFAFFYAGLHLATYLWLDQFFDWPEIWLDILDRKFITAGMLAFILLLPLAATSNKYMIKRLGRRWKKLHRLAYVAPVLGTIHFWWLVKADVLEPVIYAVILSGLFVVRLFKPR